MRCRRPLAFVPVVALLAGAPSAWAQGEQPPPMPPAIVPSAGTGPVWPSGGGFSGDGGPASHAEMDHPSQVEALPGGEPVVAGLGARCPTGRS
ncbi:MAG: hypothetical protein ACJ756_01435 [Solirubrobacterales bacterium]